MKKFDLSKLIQINAYAYEYHQDDYTILNLVFEDFTKQAPKGIYLSRLKVGLRDLLVRRFYDEKYYKKFGDIINEITKIHTSSNDK